MLQGYNWFESGGSSLREGPIEPRQELTPPDLHLRQVCMPYQVNRSLLNHPSSSTAVSKSACPYGYQG